jgi:phosphoglycerol transferase MdoB-like AlkP superfamily enzyme
MDKSNSGASTLSLLFITFLVLKLTHVITWSWWWVTAPLWGGFAIAAAVMVAFLLFGLLKALFQ